MKQRAQYLIQVLDKIGTPLLEASQHGNGDAETAQVVASLLGKVVEACISMNQALDLDATEAQDDSLRVALAALAGSIVSDQYKQKGKLPEAADLTRIQSAMSAVLTFGDNFTLSPDHVARLEKLKADGGIVDAHQINIQYVDALIPVINAVGAFPFGQPEQKLIMDVSDRLVKRTAEMREVLLPGLSGDDEKLAELAILRATANVYAACHEKETQRLSGADAPDSVSIDPVWEAFETRTAMLEAVVKNIMPEGASTQPSVVPVPPPVAPVTPETPPPPPEANPVQETPPPAAPVEQTPPPADAPQKPAIFGGETPDKAPEAEINPSPPPAEPPAAPVTPPATPPITPPVQETPAAPVESSGGASPMGFFAKPKDGATPPPEDNSVSPPLAQPEPPPAAAPIQETPPPAAPVEQTPPPAQPSEPPATAPAEDSESGGGDNGGGNPMSFFGKKD